MVQPHHSMSHRPPMHHAGLYLNSSSLCSPTSPALSQDYCTPYLEPRLLTFKVTFRTLLGSTFTPSPHPAPAAPAATCKSYVFPDLQHHHHPLTQQSTGRTGHDHRAYTWELLMCKRQPSKLSVCVSYTLFSFFILSK